MLLVESYSFEGLSDNLKVIPYYSYQAPHPEKGKNTNIWLMTKSDIKSSLVFFFEVIQPEQKYTTKP